MKYGERSLQPSADVLPRQPSSRLNLHSSPSEPLAIILGFHSLRVCVLAAIPLEVEVHDVLNSCLQLSAGRTSCHSCTKSPSLQSRICQFIPAVGWPHQTVTMLDQPFVLFVRVSCSICAYSCCSKQHAVRAARQPVLN
mmetsp:Transcript_54338/g.137255  ORF Transcript_54338/g.137255 Transcript_54338/m.137255 type:complete len:139 (+) Transcript_54338:99-515(+)